MVNTHTLLTLWVSIELLNVQENDTGAGWDSTGHITLDTRSFPTPWTTLWRCPQIGLSETECKIEINWFYSNQCLREIEFPCKKASSLLCLKTGMMMNFCMEWRNLELKFARQSSFTWGILHLHTFQCCQLWIFYKKLYEFQQFQFELKIDYQT